MDIQLRCHSACRWDSGQLGVEENCEENCFVLVGLNFHVYAGRPKTERVGVHIFAETRHATLWTGGLGWGWVGGAITSRSMCA